MKPTDHIPAQAARVERSPRPRPFAKSGAGRARRLARLAAIARKRALLNATA